MQNDYQQALQVEIAKRKQLSIEAKVMFADVKKMAAFSKGGATGIVGQMDYEFPLKPMVKELLNKDSVIRLESVDVCHKSSYDGLYGLRLNFSSGVSTDLIKTQAYRKDPTKNYKIDQSRRIGKAGARVDDAGEIYGIRF